MAVMIGLGIAGLATGIAGSLSASSDAQRQAQAQYNYQQYQQRRATDAANLKRQYNLKNQMAQREELFNSAFTQYIMNTGQLQSRYSAQVRDASQAYMATTGAMMSQFERNGLSSHSGSGRALAYAAMKNASRQLQGLSANKADAEYQLRNQLEATLSTKVNAEAPSLFIQGTAPGNPSGMSTALAGISAGLGGLQQGLALGQAYQNWQGPTPPTQPGYNGAAMHGPPNPYTVANSGAFIYSQ